MPRKHTEERHVTLHLTQIGLADFASTAQIKQCSNPATSCEVVPNSGNGDNKTHFIICDYQNLEYFSCVCSDVDNPVTHREIIKPKTN